MWGSASSPGSWHSPGPLFLAVVGGRRQGENPSSQVARAEADCSPLALCAYVRASVSLLVGRSDVGGEPGMQPFQNRIKYFEMRIVGLCFLSSRPLPVLPPCVWAEEPGGHPWHPYRAPLAKSPNRSVPRAPHPSEGSPSCLPTSQFFEKEPVSDQKGSAAQLRERQGIAPVPPMAPMENGRKKTGRGGCWRMNSWGFPLLLLPDVHPCRAPALSLPFSTGAPRCPAWGWRRLPGGFHLEGGARQGALRLAC